MFCVFILFSIYELFINNLDFGFRKARCKNPPLSEYPSSGGVFVILLNVYTDSRIIRFRQAKPGRISRLRIRFPFPPG